MATIDQFSCYHKSIPHVSYYPIISNIVVTFLGSNAVQITWTTNVPSTSQVAFGTNQNKDQRSDYDSTYVTSHSISLFGLQQNTVYFYNVQSYNIDSLSISPQNVFITGNVPSGDILMEDGSYILLEDGTKIRVEQ